VSVVINEFEVVPSSLAQLPGAASPTAAGGQQGATGASDGPATGPWAAFEIAQGQRRLAERAARLEAH
jgi:hypothetical protein